MGLACHWVGPVESLIILICSQHGSNWMIASWPFERRTELRDLTVRAASTVEGSAGRIELYREGEKEVD